MSSSNHSSVTVSVIIPAYNSERGVAKAVESLQKQTIDENALEIILVNDGSTDSTAAICHELAGKASAVPAMRESKPPGASTSPSWIATIRCFPKP